MLDLYLLKYSLTFKHELSNYSHVDQYDNLFYIFLMGSICYIYFGFLNNCTHCLQYLTFNDNESAYPSKG